MCASVGVSGVVYSSGWLPGQPLTEPLQARPLPCLSVLGVPQATATRRGDVGKRSARLSPGPPADPAVAAGDGGLFPLPVDATPRPAAHPVLLALTQLALQTLCCGTSTSRIALGDTLPRCYNHCHVRSGGTLRNPRTKPQFRAGA